jgi:hypothetical protein
MLCVAMISNQLVPIDKIKDLAPAFNNGYGWLSMTELNLLDPNCERFEAIDEMFFVNGEMFVNVVPKLNEKWERLKSLVK